MEPAQALPTYTSNDVSLYGLFSLFFRNWLTLVLSAFTFAVIAALWAINQPNIYKAEMLLMSASGDKGGLGSLGGDLSGLAAIAGVTMPDSGNDNTKLALELVKSRVFVGEFIKEHDLLVPLMAANGWDIQSNKLLYDDNIYDIKTKTWLRKVKAPKQQTPSLQEAHLRFLTMLNVEQDSKTKFVKISVEFYSPDISADWTTKIVAALNRTIREIDMLEATSSIAYLQELINESNVTDLKNVFSSLMEEQIKSKMLATIRPNYVFKVVDPAIAPENKSKPQRAIIVILAGFFGGIIGLVIVLFMAGRRNELQSNQTL
jgi:uncharacterized protein involved in exopolysaccharide biosynthesis